MLMPRPTSDAPKAGQGGHTGIRTTEVYLRMNPSEKLEAVEAVIPPE